MAKIKWKHKDEIEKEQKELEKKENEREKLKDKSFKTLSQKEKDELLEKIARQLGYL